MTDLDDQISAYLDGAMTADEQLRFEAELAANPELSARFERWQQNDARMQSSYALDALPDGMLERLGLGEDHALNADNVIPFRAKTGAPPANDNIVWWKRGLPLGAAAAAAIAAIGLWTLAPSTDLADDPAFQTAMEKTTSGTPTALANNDKVQPILSFASAKGDFCREFAVGSGPKGKNGIACRGDRNWKVEAVVNGAPDLGGTGEIRTAAGTDVRALEHVYDRLGASDPINNEKENTLISTGWKKIQ